MEPWSGREGRSAILVGNFSNPADFAQETLGRIFGSLCQTEASGNRGKLKQRTGSFFALSFTRCGTHLRGNHVGKEGSPMTKGIHPDDVR